jgi:hypothetical protein
MTKRSGVLVLLCALLMSGCGKSDDSDGSDESRGPGGTTSSEADRSTEPTATPVEILRRIKGCAIQDGAVIGEQDMNGNLYASCELPPVDYSPDYAPAVPTVTARVVGVDPRTLTVEDYPVIAQDDSDRTILGDDFFLNVSAEPEALALVDVDAIADQVGGEALPFP